jgi:hypothetical protein
MWQPGVGHRDHHHADVEARDVLLVLKALICGDAA